MKCLSPSLLACVGLLTGTTAFAQAKPAAALTSSAPIVSIQAHAGPVAKQSGELLQSGAEAPDFVTKDAAGKEVRLSDFKGKIVILDFWATWCGPCMASMPHTQEIAGHYKNQDVVVLAVCTSDTRAKFEAWMKKNQPKYPDMVITCDLNDQGSATFDERVSHKLFHVQGIPTQFIIGRDGKIAGTLVGYDVGETRAEAVLAGCGVTVDPAVVAKGAEQIKKAADEDAKRAQAEAANPKPPFREDFGKTVAGTVLPDFPVLTEDGKDAKLSDFMKGKATVVIFWSGGALPSAGMEYFATLARKYRDQGLSILGLTCFTRRTDFDSWVAANQGKHGFPVVFDPADMPPKPEKDFSDMTPDEKKAYGKLQYAAMSKSINMRLLNINGTTPMPSYLVTDRDGRLVGWSVGWVPTTPQAVCNLLLRAGIQLDKEDMPARIYTHEETKPPTPEAAVAMLKPGAVAPDFTALDAAGSEVKLSDYNGKVIIVDFWATWCGPCMASMPHTQEVAAHYKDQGVVVFANCTSDDRGKYESWVKANQAKYPDMIFSYDPAGRKPERVSHRLYGVSGIPQQFVIGRDGKVAATVTGYLKGEVILENALSKAGIAVDPAIVAKGEQDLKNR